MLKGMMSLLLCASLTFGQGIGIPFSMNGGPMQVSGTFTAGNGGQCCSGVAAMGGEVVPFTGKCFLGPLGYSWRFTLQFDDAIFIMWIFVNQQTGQLSGYFYETGVHGPVTPLYP